MTRRPIVLYTICIAYVTTRASSPLFNTSNTQSLILACSFAPFLFAHTHSSYLPFSSQQIHTPFIYLFAFTHTQNFISLSKFFFFLFFSFVVPRGGRANENNAQKYANIMRVYKFANGGNSDEVFVYWWFGGGLTHYLLSTLFSAKYKFQAILLFRCVMLVLLLLCKTHFGILSPSPVCVCVCNGKISHWAQSKRMKRKKNPRPIPRD